MLRRRRRDHGSRLAQCAAVAFGLSVGLGSADTARACSCPQVKPAAFVKRAAIILEGIPTKIELIFRQNPDRPFDFQGSTIRSTIRVVRAYKGKLGPEVVIESHLGSSLCGWQPYGVGRRQIFAAYKSQGRYRTHSCTMGLLGGRAATNPYLKLVRSLEQRGQE